MLRGTPEKVDCPWDWLVGCMDDIGNYSIALASILLYRPGCRVGGVSAFAIHRLRIRAAANTGASVARAGPERVDALVHALVHAHTHTHARALWFSLVDERSHGSGDGVVIVVVLLDGTHIGR